MATNFLKEEGFGVDIRGSEWWIPNLPLQNVDRAEQEAKILKYCRIYLTIVTKVGYLLSLSLPFQSLIKNTFHHFSVVQGYTIFFTPA